MVTITDLTVKDQDFVFDGDIRLLGAISITNGNFIVNGHVLLEENGSFYIERGNITCKSLEVESGGCYNLFIVKYGDVSITEGNFYLNCNVEIIGDLVVDKGFAMANNISVFSIYVNGDVRFNNVKALNDILFEAGDIAGNINCDGDMYAENHCNFNGNDIFIKGTFICPCSFNLGRLAIN